MRESMEVLFMNQFKCLNYKPIKQNNTMEKFLSEFIPANQEIDVERYERLGYTVTKNSKVWRLRKLTNLKEHERLGSE